VWLIKSGLKEVGGTMDKYFFFNYRNLLLFCMAVLCFSTNPVQALDLGRISVMGVSVHGESKEEVLAKARRIAIESALIQLGVNKATPAYKDISEKLGTDFKKYIINQTGPMRERRGNWKAKLNFTVDANSLFSFIMEKVNALIKEKGNPEIIIAFFLSSSNYQFDGMGLNETFLGEQQKRFNSEFKETLESVGFKVIKNDEIPSILGEIAENLYEPPDSTSSFKKRILGKVTASGRPQFIFFGSIDVVGAKLVLNVKHSVTAKLSGDLIDLSDPQKSLSFNESISQSYTAEGGKGWGLALGGLVSIVADKMLVQKGVVHIINSWEREATEDKIVLKICDFRSNRAFYSKVKKFLINEKKMIAGEAVGGAFQANLNGFNSGIDLEDALYEKFPEEINSGSVISDGKFVGLSFSKGKTCKR
jgi:hypothetical protein